MDLHNLRKRTRSEIFYTTKQKTSKEQILLSIKMTKTEIDEKYISFRWPRCQIMVCELEWPSYEIIFCDIVTMVLKHPKVQNMEKEREMSDPLLSKSQTMTTQQRTQA